MSSRAVAHHSPRIEPGQKAK